MPEFRFTGHVYARLEFDREDKPHECCICLVSSVESAEGQTNTERGVGHQMIRAGGECYAF